jgi:hypothetical protein
MLPTTSLTNTSKTIGIQTDKLTTNDVGQQTVNIQMTTSAQTMSNNNVDKSSSLCITQLLSKEQYTNYGYNSGNKTSNYNSNNQYDFAHQKFSVDYLRYVI